MISATGFHRGVHVDRADIDEATDACPVCRSRQSRQAIFKIQEDPKIDMLLCTACSAASASHMPRPALLDRYYAQYYKHNTGTYTFHNPQRFARHLLGIMRGVEEASSLRILDFGGGDGSLAAVMAQALQDRAARPIPITIEVIDYAAPRDSGTASVSIVGRRDLAEVQGQFNIILASAILEHIPDAHSAIRGLVALARSGTFMYARTPYVLPIARLLPAIDITYPAHVHDMGAAFWHRFIETFGLRARLVSSRPSLVETTLRDAPLRTVAAHVLKLPALAELKLFRRSRPPRWSLVGGWEAVLQFT
jgi:2-polyprenyl-3-methyl-5-hydroxy-6-metoxy-1,4-benzoquinol methylase